jgi:hypothetical protein
VLLLNVIRPLELALLLKRIVTTVTHVLSILATKLLEHVSTLLRNVLAHLEMLDSVIPLPDNAIFLQLAELHPIVNLDNSVLLKEVAKFNKQKNLVNIKK